MFAFDPTQEQKFREKLQGKTDDIQIKGGVTSRQEVLLAEAARRVKTYRGLATEAKHDRPLVVLVSKFDVWRKLLGVDRLPEPWSLHSSGNFSVLRTDIIAKVSDAIRGLLRKLTPAIVSTAETFVDPSRIIYIPVSATGGPPERGATGLLGHRAGAIAPIWAEVPMLYVLSQYGSTGVAGGGMIPFLAVPQKAAGAAGNRVVPSSEACQEPTASGNDSLSESTVADPLANGPAFVKESTEGTR